MRLLTQTALRILAGTYFVLTSLYLLLGFLPYTYFFLIKAPPYSWMPWFVRYHAALYWFAAVAAMMAGWNLHEAWRNRNRLFFGSVAVFILIGISLTAFPVLPHTEPTASTYWCSIAALFPLMFASLFRRSSNRPSSGCEGAKNAIFFPYAPVILISIVVSCLYIVGASSRNASHTQSFVLHATDLEHAVWSLASHLILALAIFSILNLVALIATKNEKPFRLQLTINAALAFFALAFVLHWFLDSALSFNSRLAVLYSVALALSLVLWGLWIIDPFLKVSAAFQAANRRLGTWIVLLASSTLAITFPLLIGDADWSGFLQGTVTLSIWVVVSVCAFRLRPARAPYSLALILSVMIFTGVAYKTLQATEIFWSKPLGTTDDEISLDLEAYGSNDNSFFLAHHILGNRRNEVCGDLCRILRENTNIRDTRALADIDLVNSLTPNRSERPNIFIFVIDSMRPDYLGAYNSSIDYTPNLDAFARDSIVLHHAYSQYAGTSLSEPAIWSGAMMLHAHYLQPFSRLNSLDRLLHIDEYRMLVSSDEVLSAIMPADPHVVSLDTDKKLWNQLEIGSTLQQAETFLDAHPQQEQPIFLYAQPKNVHQFARNDVPSPTSQHWPDRPGLNTRITYEVHWVDSCLGQFFGYLKQHGLYDNSIIIVTSDHGDATGEFGRTSHSTSIWPEIMRVPLIMHLPTKMRREFVYDDTRLSTLTDIAPTLYYVLGHGPIRQNPLYGRPLLAKTKQELDSYQPHDLLLSSDVRAVYGILSEDGQYLYTTYDSPAESYLFDLVSDPNAQHSILTPALKQRYDEEIIEHL
ncbi:MAG TPA: sulfatase-like hydrolase/transferase, partial [Candidatus Eisenbacteria bacterium]|nr:sulfatase-like hydrolase/transferase [Candidatus Eisenbacteria bacterium]